MSIRFTDLLDLARHEAVSLLAEEYKKTGDFPTLRNLSLLLLDTGQWQFVKDNYEVIIRESEYAVDRDFITLGMANWFMNDESSALDPWQRACDAEYTDAVGAIDGPLLLWYAGRRLGDDELLKQSLKKLKRFWKVADYRKIVKWPGTQAIAGFLLAEVPLCDFVSKWRFNVGSLEFRRLCRANFWVGMTRLETSEDEAIRYFQAAFSDHKIAILEYEYFLAKWEYARLTKEDMWNF